MDDDAIASDLKPIPNSIPNSTTNTMLIPILRKTQAPLLSWFLRLSEAQKILTDAVDELEYYAAYDPHMINCAIAYLIFKPTEIALTRGIESLSTLFVGDGELIKASNDNGHESKS
jgi:hypothetical protein